MIRLSFTVPGPPVPKARARVYQQQNKRTGQVETRAITPDKTRAYEKHVQTCAYAAWLRLKQTGVRWPLDAIYGLSVRVYRSRDMGDLSNYEKSIEDGAEGILWTNDKKIHRRGEGGIWHVPKGQERIEVEAWIVE